MKIILLKRQAFKNAEKLSDKNLAYEELFDAYAKLPAGVKSDDKQDQLSLWKKDLSYLNSLENFNLQEAVENKKAEFLQLRNAFNALTLEQKVPHQVSFDAATEEQLRLDTYAELINAFREAVDDAQKIKINLDLQKAFGLLKNQQRYAGEAGACADEAGFLTAMQTVASAMTLTSWMSAWRRADDAYMRLTDAQQAVYSPRKQNLDAIASKYNYFLKHNWVTGDADMNMISRARRAIPADQNLDALDASIWNSILAATNRAENPKQELTPVEINDLIILKAFCDKKLGENVSAERPYENEINNFYTKALATRLSPQLPRDQLKEIKKIAYQEFQHRDFKKRLAADIAMLTSILFLGLGVAIMIGRKYKYDACFFSTAYTNRNKELTSNWLNENGLEDNLFVEPRPVVV